MPSETRKIPTARKAELMQLAWPGLVVEDSNLSVQVAALRKLLGSAGDGGEWIVTVPRAGYRLIGAVAVEDSTLAPVEAHPSDRGGRPSVAVLPFTNLRDDPSRDYFADGVTEDIIAALTRFRWFSVVGRNASHAYKVKRADASTAARELGVRYLLEGAVRQAGNRVRISAQLSDASSGDCGGSAETAPRMAFLGAGGGLLRGAGAYRRGPAMAAASA